MTKIFAEIFLCKEKFSPKKIRKKKFHQKKKIVGKNLRKKIVRKKKFEKNLNNNLWQFFYI